MGNCVEGEGPVTTKTLDLPEIKSIELASVGKVFIKQAPVQKITIKGQQNIIDLVKTTVRNEEWIIDFERCIKTSKKVEVYLELPNIIKIDLEGSGEIIGENTIESNELRLEINGSGDMDLDLNVKELQSEISGSGDIRLRGSTKNHGIRIKGSGDVQAFDLNSDVTEVEIDGSGDAKVNVSYSLDVDVDGSGDVYYKGSVKEISSQIEGSGKLHQQD
jgi:hypothetical protein